MEFTDFKLNESILRAVDAMGYKQPTPVQVAAIPLIIEGKDIIACAQTGTGKTAAYLLPILHRMITENQVGKGSHCLIIVPTRELALQIDQQLQGFAYFAGANSVTVYGGGDSVGWDYQKKALTEGADIIIATPGRLISHMNLDYVKMQDIRYLVLDEADKMLDMGFYDDILRIISDLPKQRQTLLLSATMPDRIRQLAKKIMKQPAEVNIAVSKPAENILQACYQVEDELKPSLLKSLLQGKDLKSILVFCSTKRDVKLLEKELRRIRFMVRAIHSDLDQPEREEVMREFRNRKFQILVATDILSRGIDIEGIDLVINYNVPADPEDYIHRIGRTARAEAEGLAITLVNQTDRFRFKRIEKFLEHPIYRIPLPQGLLETKGNEEEEED